MIYAVAFVASGAIVVLAASTLARAADVIAERTGLGRIWVGSMLLAFATSLPELVTDVSAVRLGATDLAVGDLFGSSMANMLVLAVIDLASPHRRVLQLAAFDHALAAALAIALNALAAAFVLTASGFALFGLTPGALVLFVAYLAGARAIYQHTARTHPREAQPPPAAPAGVRTGLRHTAVMFAAAALVVLGAAPAFAWSASGLAEVSGLGQTFMGTWLVGLATSLPELAASLAAVRMGAYDLAVGNLFGSNALNMAIFLPLDLAQPGSLFAGLDPAHALTGLFAVVLTSLGLAAMVFRATRRFGMAEPNSLLILLSYLAAIALLFARTAG